MAMYKCVVCKRRVHNTKCVRIKYRLLRSLYMCHNCLNTVNNDVYESKSLATICTHAVADIQNVRHKLHVLSDTDTCSAKTHSSILCQIDKLLLIIDDVYKDIIVKLQ